MSYENILAVFCTFIVGLSYWLVNRIILFRKGVEEMKVKEMATAFQNLACDAGINLDEMALRDSATISLIPPDSQFFTISGTCYTSIEPNYYRPRRLKCMYCDCISSKESGTCEHCGAPLVEDEY